MKQVTKLDWDSDFFEKRIGKVLITDENDFDGLLFNEEANGDFDLIYVFSHDKMLSNKNVVLCNLDLVDIMITMSMPFNPDLFKDKEYDFKTSISDKELKECYEISEQTSIVSRFYDEKMIGPKKTKKLYRKWIDNAFTKSFSDGIFVAKESNIIKGIHLIKVDNANKVGYFTLTGVNQNNKKAGFGRKLWEQSFGFFANETDINIIKSPFSQKNLDSFNFHLKMGFNKLEEVKYVYHYRNKK